MDKQLIYTIEEVNCYHNTTKLCIGYIVECFAEKNYGIIYQYNDENNSSECKIRGLYYFRKEEGMEIPQNTLVSFLKDYSNSWKRIFEVNNVNLLSDYDIYIVSSKEERSAFDANCSTDSMVSMMNSAKKFIVVVKDEEDNHYTCRLYYPIINSKSRTITYYFFTSSFFENPITICDCLAYVHTNQPLQFSQIQEKIVYSN